MKFFCVATILLFVASHIPAQTITWSAPFTDDKKMQYLKIIGTDENGFYILRSNLSFENLRDRSGFRNRKYSLEYFDSDMRLKWSQQLTSSVPDAKIASVICLNDRVLVVSALASKQSKIYRLYGQYLDNKGAYVDSASVLDEFGYEKMNDDSRPDVIVSHDQSKGACAFRKTSPSGKDDQVFEALSFDTTLKVIYKKEIPVPQDTKHFVPVDFLLTDEGNFFLLGIKYDTDKKVKAPNESFYQLYSYTTGNNEISSREIKIEDKFLTDAGISADNLNRKVVVAGFYSDKTTYSTAGVFYYALNEDSTAQTTIKSSPFSAAFLSKFLGERKENNNKELLNYSIDRLILRKDGGAAILAESYYETASSYWDYYTQTYISHRYYHFGNIICLSVNPDGSILWSDAVTKDQNSTDDGGYLSSYTTSITEGKIFCIYNKYVEQESSVLMTTIDGTGKQKTDVLFNEIKNISVVPRSARQIDSETLLLPAYRENKFYIARIEF